MSVVSSSFRQRVRAGIEKPVAGFFGRLGLTPNALTLIGFAIAIVGALAAARQLWLVAGLIIAFGAVFDLFDGALARATGKTSKLGAFLDSVFDRAGEAVVYIGIAWGLDFVRDVEGSTPGGGIFAMTALAASLLVSYTRAKSDSLGYTAGTGMASVGFAPREVRMVILVLALVVTDLLGGVGSTFYPTTGSFVLTGSLVIITLLATLTTIQRIYFVYQQANKQQTDTQKPK
jgi:CDP-diacylglycerol--glycerol-3-phosphate 3-phosphatidyltransferase